MREGSASSVSRVVLVGMLIFGAAPTAGAAFATAPAMGTPRSGHTATLLPDGKVLVAGGFDGAAYLSTAEIYDPFKRTFAATGSMAVPRSAHTALLLPNGKVLIAGGFNGATLSSAELYDPVSRTFTATGSMSAARSSHTATLLQNGKVLVAGGAGDAGSLAAAELYDPSGAGTFASAASMGTARARHTATLLASGNVLIAGGENASGIVSAAEVYAGGSFFAAPSMTTARRSHTSTLLPDGKVLIAGGTSSGGALDSAELYTGAGFTATGTMISARSAHSATLLPDGTALIVGGADDGVGADRKAERYDASAGTFVTAGLFNDQRENHTATLLNSGKVLIAGGRKETTSLSGAAFYDPPAGSFTPAGGLSTTRSNPTATLLPSGKVLIVGTGQSTELFDPGTGTFSPSGMMLAARTEHTATLLQNGQVLMAGGQHFTTTQPGLTELYDPLTGTFTATGPLLTERRKHTATLLANGRVLLAGGLDVHIDSVDSAELYDPDSGTFTSAGTMLTRRSAHTATLLPNGQVLIAGGSRNVPTFEFLTSTEIYDPATNSFTPGTTMTYYRTSYASATLLPNGKVLIAGGAYQEHSNAELYDPATKTFKIIPMACRERSSHTATLLPSGDVLITGGWDSNCRWKSEVFHPDTETFTMMEPLTIRHVDATATLLQNGLVLIAGGYLPDDPGDHPAVLYDDRGIDDSRRPILSQVPAIVCQPASHVFSGSGFIGGAEGSSGTTQNSATNAAWLRLQRLDSEQAFIASRYSATDTSFATTFAGMPSGHYRVSIVKSSVPSLDQIMLVDTTPVVGAYRDATAGLTQSITVAPTLPAEYFGLNVPLTVSASPGFTGTLRVNATTGGVSVGNAGPAGAHTVTISAVSPCGSATTSFGLDVVAPHSLAVTGGTPQRSGIGTAFEEPLAVTVKGPQNQVLSGIRVAFSAPATGASATLAGGGVAETDSAGVARINATANATPGTYVVTATVGGLTATFDLTNLSLTIEATAGTPQTAIRSTQFALPLRVTVKDSDGQPAAGVRVTFTAPAAGPSVTFSGGSVVMTDSSGVATVLVTANQHLGSYVVKASAGTLETTFSLTNIAPEPKADFTTTATPTSFSRTRPARSQCGSCKALQSRSVAASRSQG